MTPLTPAHLEAQELRRKIATLFADGRERTVGDVARETGATVKAATANMRKMRDMGLLRMNVISPYQPTIWQSTVEPKA